MVLIRTTDRAALAALADDFDVVDDFEHVDLGDVNTLELGERSDGAFESWMHGEPAVFDEEGGLVVVALAPEGLAWVLAHADALAEGGADPEAVRAFCAAASDAPVYVVDTF